MSPVRLPPGPGLIRQPNAHTHSRAERGPTTPWLIKGYRRLFFIFSRSRVAFFRPPEPSIRTETINQLTEQSLDRK